MKRSVNGFRLAAAALALVIFLVDTLTPLEGAVAVLYVIVILLAAATGRRRDIISAGVASFLLTIAAYIYSHGAARVGDPTIRAGVSLAAIGITTLLALRNQRTTTQLAAEERRFRRMFAASRMGIVLEDWSAVRTELAELGTLDAAAIRSRIERDPDLVSRARRLAMVLDSNPAFLKMIGTSGSLRRPETMDDVLGAMESGRMAMHALDYQRLSLQLREAMGSLRLDDLLFIARQGDGILPGLAENLLYDIGAETLIDAGPRSREAVRLTRDLLHRMAMDPNAAA